MDVVQAIDALTQGGRRPVHVGTDGRHRGIYTDFVTVIAVLDPGRGGRIFYRRERVPRRRSLADKLFREVELSVQTANTLNGAARCLVTIHVDANTEARHESSVYVQALAGMVVGYGYDVRVKPDAWCASHAADFVVKDKISRLRGASA